MTKAQVNKKVTIIAKTFERPQCAERLLESIRLYYPRIEVIIVDDSTEPRPLDKCTYLTMPFDSGASAGRNFALKHVKTPYFVTVDDDFIFTERTRLEIWLEILESHPIDLISGIAGNLEFVGAIEVNDGVFRIIRYKSKGQIGPIKLFDITAQFFMARLDKVLEFGAWDEDYKTGVEHRDFFFRAKDKLVVGFCPQVHVNHPWSSTSNLKYCKARSRSRETIDLFLKKHNLREMQI